MGVGKTSVGQVLARRCDMDFVDADTDIEKNAKMPISRIFHLHGEGHFRCLEYDFYLKLSYVQNTVIATGGGAILDERIRTILRKNTFVVYLMASPEVVYFRIAADESRPLLSGGDKKTIIADMLSEREALYRQTCHVVINTNNMDINECAEKVSQMFFDLTKRLR